MSSERKTAAATLTDDPDRLNAFLIRYNAAWNEADPSARRSAVAALWAESGTVVNSERAYRGPDEVFDALTRAYEDFVARGYRFDPLPAVLAHHGGIWFRWEMARADGGPSEAVGTNFLLLDDEGRVLVDHQFVEA